MQQFNLFEMAAGLPLLVDEEGKPGATMTTNRSGAKSAGASIHTRQTGEACDAQLCHFISRKTLCSWNLVIRECLGIDANRRRDDRERGERQPYQALRLLPGNPTHQKFLFKMVFCRQSSALRLSLYPALPVDRPGPPGSGWHLQNHLYRKFLY